MTWADGKMLGFDLETTAADPTQALPVSFALVAFDFGQIGKARMGLVNPGVPIPPESTGIHGITDEMVHERGGDLEKSINGIWSYLMDVEQMGIPLVGCNIRYDLTVIDTQLRRFTRHGLRELGWGGLCLDALVLDRYVDRYRTGKRTLAALCHNYQVSFGAAHEATTDVVASVEVVRAIAARSRDLRETPLEMVQLLQQETYHDWATTFSEYRVQRGEEPLGENDYGWPLPGEIPEEGT